MPLVIFQERAQDALDRRNEAPGGGMFHGLANHTYGATAGLVFVVAGVSGALIMYAVFTFLDILSAPPAIDLLRAAF